MSERWLGSNQYCPACGCFPLKNYANNKPVADFFCGDCGEQFELKSQRGRIGRTVADGAYRTMIDRITSNTNPSFLFLSYDTNLFIKNLELVPKHFLSPQVIKARKPLAPHARRAGWEGCNILMEEIAPSGRIALILDGSPCRKSDVLQAWQNTIFLQKQKAIASKSWLLSVMRCVERLGRPTFSVEEVYAFEPELSANFPSNKHIRPKVRQQLQVLRDNGYLEFLGGGKYRRLTGA